MTSETMTATLEELTKQFEQLTESPTHQKKSFDSTFLAPEAVVPSPLSSSSPLRTASLFASPWKTISSKNGTWWTLPLVFGGLFVFVLLLVACLQPRFLYSAEQQRFVWRSFFVTSVVSYLALLAVLYGIYYYLNRF